MLAGATGIDLALLVVAADDSVMPQTREHLEILKLLGLRHGLIALTKADLVDDTTREVVALEVRELVQGHVPRRRPDRPHVGAHRAWGSTELEGGDSLADVRTRSDERSAGTEWFRLPIDRAFVVQGHGTVVTGSVTSRVGRGRRRTRLAQGRRHDRTGPGPRAEQPRQAGRRRSTAGSGRRSTSPACRTSASAAGRNSPPPATSSRARCSRSGCTRSPDVRRPIKHRLPVPAARRHRRGDGDRFAPRLRPRRPGRVGARATLPRRAGDGRVGPAVRAARLVGRTHARRRAGAPAGRGEAPPPAPRSRWSGSSSCGPTTPSARAAAVGVVRRVPRVRAGRPRPRGRALPPDAVEPLVGELRRGREAGRTRRCRRTARLLVHADRVAELEDRVLDALGGAARARTRW